MQSLLIAARALHFASVISLAGSLVFAWAIAESAFRRAGLDEPAVAKLRRRFLRLSWASLALALVSGAAWLAGTASEMSGKPIAEVLSQGIATTVLIRTRFGQDWLLRLILAALLATCLYAENSSGPALDWRFASQRWCWPSSCWPASPGRDTGRRPRAGRAICTS